MAQEKLWYRRHLVGAKRELETENSVHFIFVCFSRDNDDQIITMPVRQYYFQMNECYLTMPNWSTDLIVYLITWVTDRSTNLPASNSIYSIEFLCRYEKVMNQSSVLLVSLFVPFFVHYFHMTIVHMLSIFSLSWRQFTLLWISILRSFY